MRSYVIEKLSSPASQAGLAAWRPRLLGMKVEEGLLFFLVLFGFCKCFFFFLCVFQVCSLFVLRFLFFWGVEHVLLWSLSNSD